jgi:hypothetical protein
VPSGCPETPPTPVVAPGDFLAAPVSDASAPATSTSGLNDQARQYHDHHMATAHPAPDPFDDEITALLRDPSVIAHLDDLRDRREQGTLVTHSDAEVRERLRSRGLPIPNEPDPDA